MPQEPLIHPLLLLLRQQVAPVAHALQLQHVAHFLLQEVLHEGPQGPAEPLPLLPKEAGEGGGAVEA